MKNNFINQLKTLYSSKTVSKLVKEEFAILCFQYIISLTFIMYSYLSNGKLTIPMFLLAVIPVPAINLLFAISKLTASTLPKQRVVKHFLFDTWLNAVNTCINIFWIHFNIPYENLISQKAMVLVEITIIIYLVFSLTSAKMRNKNKKYNK